MWEGKEEGHARRWPCFFFVPRSICWAQRGNGPAILVDTHQSNQVLHTALRVLSTCEFMVVFVCVCVREREREREREW